MDEEGSKIGNSKTDSNSNKKTATVVCCVIQRGRKVWDEKKHDNILSRPPHTAYNRFDIKIVWIFPTKANTSCHRTHMHVHGRIKSRFQIH